MDDFEQDEGFDPSPTQSSIAAPLIRALLFAAIAFGIYAVVFGDLGAGTDLAPAGTNTPVASTAPVGPTEPAPPLESLPTGGPSASPAVSPSPSAAAGGQIGSGVTVQVIAGANTAGDQFDAAVQALTQLGYDVTESGTSPNAYAQTTVFATAGEEAQADALVGADPRFTTTAPNPGTLSDQIQIHVLVGEDWPAS
ncbi:MAG: LytR C-terminal domain-containing protein [Euzebya sp.]